MLILPRSNPLYENLLVQKINLPEAIKKMGAGGFTGYLGYGSNSSEGYFVFIKGALISALMLEGNKRKNGFEAFTSLFNHALLEGGAINVYRMTVDLAVCTQALLHGTLALKPEPVSAIDLKAVFAQMKLQMLNGAALFSTPERSAIIFYKDGAPIGFYHDAVQEIETSPAESQRIAALPGAVIEIRSTPPADELLHHNFLETLNIDKLWQSLSLRTNQKATLKPEAEKTTACESAAVTPSVQKASYDPIILNEILEDLKEIAKAYLGRRGAELVECQLEAAGGLSVLHTPSAVDRLLHAITEESPAIDPEARIEEMTDLMKSEITGRLSIS